MKRLLMLLVAALVAWPTFAQFTADRPGASTGPSVVNRGVFQWEQGMQYDGDGHEGSYTFSNTLLRYGLFDGVEVRLGGDAFLTDGDIYFSGLTFGTKIGLYEGKGGVPAISLMANLAIPGTASAGCDVDHLAPSLYLLFENALSDRLSLGYNVGVEWNGYTAKPSAFVALCLGASLTDRLGCFVESYNNLWGEEDNFYGADFGLNYMVGERVQLDLSAALDVCDPAHCWAVSFGVAWQITNPKR